jgi:hypothetical protein
MPPPVVRVYVRVCGVARLFVSGTNYYCRLSRGKRSQQ